MQQSGRKGLAASSVVAEVAIDRRLEAPQDLTEYEASIWREVVNTKPAEWFGRDTAKLLSSYCKHCSTAYVIDKQIEEFDPLWLAEEDGLKRYERLTNIREKQTRAINALARSMRITQQSQYDEKKASRMANKTSGDKKPWQK